VPELQNRRTFDFEYVDYLYRPNSGIEIEEGDFE